MPKMKHCSKFLGNKHHSDNDTNIKELMVRKGDLVSDLGATDEKD